MEHMRRTLRSDDVEARIRDDIDAGTYRPGDRLPAPEELATELRKLTKAVDSAYRRLVEDGVLVEGLLEPGFFVADPATDPTVRTLLQAVRGTQLRLERLEQRLAELTERVASVERGLRSARREGGGYDQQF
ncbi:GntR family transcriptional regulator [Streptomyces sp. NA02950]|uniref:GntR family transcriptional regulator n=1 Tax=Streptomyces sp. NA02950 TaxID=2742137 RepID=UPI00159112E6|nr:GntR family transcriptional regulator [Streptomyces sp. NA02950]QKV94178.1 GntR family transcriptional regulator [Streptomyces sp. NA02950]